MAFKPGIYSDKSIKCRLDWYRKFMSECAVELGDAAMANDAVSMNMRFCSFIAIALVRTVRDLGSPR